MSSTSNIYLGNLNIEGAYFGGLEVEAMYIGENEVYSSGPFVGLRLSPTAPTIDYSGGTVSLKVKSSEDWTLSMDSTYLSADTYTGTTGETIVTVTVADNTGNTDIETTITAASANFIAESTVTISHYIPGTSIKYHTTGSTEITFSGITGYSLLSHEFDSSTGWGERVYDSGLTVFTQNAYKSSMWTSDGKLTDIEIGEGFVRMQDGSLAYNTSLSAITLPSTIQYLEVHWKLFGYNVNKLTIKATTPPNAGSGAFADGGWASTGTLYVPAGSISAYQAWLPSQLSGWTVTAIV